MNLPRMMSTVMALMMAIANVRYGMPALGVLWFGVSIWTFTGDWK